MNSICVEYAHPAPDMTKPGNGVSVRSLVLKAFQGDWFDAAITVITLSLSAVLDADGVSSLWPEHAATLAANTMAVSAANARRIHVFIGVSFIVRCLCGAGVRLRVYICTARPRATYMCTRLGSAIRA